jgi:hypothetical protein
VSLRLWPSFGGQAIVPAAAVQAARSGRTRMPISAERPLKDDGRHDCLPHISLEHSHLRYIIGLMRAIPCSQRFAQNRADDLVAGLLPASSQYRRGMQERTEVHGTLASATPEARR